MFFLTVIAFSIQLYVTPCIKSWDLPTSEILKKVDHWAPPVEQYTTKSYVKMQINIKFCEILSISSWSSESTKLVSHTCIQIDGQTLLKNSQIVFGAFRTCKCIKNRKTNFILMKVKVILVKRLQIYHIFFWNDNT